jgi:hypothetical protein
MTASSILAGTATRAPAPTPRNSAEAPKLIEEARKRFDVRMTGAPSELERRLAVALLKLQDRADTACNAVRAAIQALPNDTDADASRGVLELLESNSVSLSNEMFDVAGMALLAAQGTGSAAEEVLTDGGYCAMPQEPDEVAVDGGAQAKYGRALRREQLLARLPVLLDYLIEALGEVSGDSQASYVLVSVAREAACELQELEAANA